MGGGLVSETVDAAHGQARSGAALATPAGYAAWFSWFMARAGLGVGPVPCARGPVPARTKKPARPEPDSPAGPAGLGLPEPGVRARQPGVTPCGPATPT